jgi:hypothetical protein
MRVDYEKCEGPFCKTMMPVGRNNGILGLFGRVYGCD